MSRLFNRSVLFVVVFISAVVANGQTRSPNRTRPRQYPQVSQVPSPDPNGSVVRQQYPQQQGQPPVTDACFIQVNPPAGCMYTPYVYYAGTSCTCRDVNGNVYAGEFLLY